MEFELDLVLENWRKGVCERCGKNSEPIYRFCYSAKKTDLHGNSLIDFEIHVCRKCCSSLEKKWKTKCDNITPLIKT